MLVKIRILLENLEAQYRATLDRETLLDGLKNIKDDVILDGMVPMTVKERKFQLQTNIPVLTQRILAIRDAIEKIKGGAQNLQDWEEGKIELKLAEK